MNYRNIFRGIFFLALMCLLGAQTLRAQEEPQQPPPTQEPQPPQEPQQPWEDTKPKPAGQSNPYFNLGDLLGNPGNLQPDYTPLTGMLNAGLGFPEVKHSYWVPGVQFSSQMQSYPNNSSSGSNLYGSNYVAGNLSLLEAWSRSQLAVNYSGGAYFTTSSNQGNIMLLSTVGIRREFSTQSLDHSDRGSVLTTTAISIWFWGRYEPRCTRGGWFARSNNSRGGE